MKSIVSLSDCNLDKEFEFGETFYSIGDEIEDTKIQEWIVAGHYLRNAANYRDVDCILYSHPISTYVVQVKKINLSDLKIRNKISKTKQELIDFKKEQLKNHFKKLTSEIEIN